jgi:CO/xanthine dehydrogenase FAD-binding subunit
MKPAPFEYLDPTTVAEALALLARHGENAKLLAGGQSLVPLMNMRVGRPQYVIDLNRIEALAYIRERDGGLAIGAMTRQEALEHAPLVTTRVPLLPEALALLGHPAIRHLGTIGGSVAHADPAAELPAAIFALDGRITVVGPHGERTLESMWASSSPSRTAWCGVKRPVNASARRSRFCRSAPFATFASTVPSASPAMRARASDPRPERSGSGSARSTTRRGR